jgi:hypothetical protein
MSMRLSAFVLVASLCVAAVACGNTAPPVEQAQQVVPEVPANLLGNWFVINVAPADGSPAIYPAQPGLAIFEAGGYAAIIGVSTADPRPLFADPLNPTDAEKAAAYDSFLAVGGPYEVSGSTLTIRAAVARHPGLPGGGHVRFDFTINGVNLQLTVEEVMLADRTTMPEPVGTVTTYQRLP